MASVIITIVVGLAALLIGLLVGYILRKSIGEKTIGNAETKARNMLLDAEKNAESIKKEIVLEAKEEAQRQRNSADKEIRERRNEISKAERRLNQKEDSIDRKLERDLFSEQRKFPQVRNEHVEKLEANEADQRRDASADNVHEDLTVLFLLGSKVFSTDYYCF